MHSSSSAVKRLGSYEQSEVKVRNSIKYVASKNQKEFIKDLKLIYQATTKELAEEELLKLDEKWVSNTP